MSDRSSRDDRQEIELAGSHAIHAFASGVRSSLRNNASAYGFSVTITVSFALVSATHPRTTTAVPVLLFAAAAATAFFIVEAMASRLFQHVADVEDPGRVTFVSGAVDGFAVLGATGDAIGLSEIPGIAAWPAMPLGR